MGKALRTLGCGARSNLHPSLKEFRSDGGKTVTAQTYTILKSPCTCSSIPSSHSSNALIIEHAPTITSESASQCHFFTDVLSEGNSYMLCTCCVRQYAGEVPIFLLIYHNFIALFTFYEGTKVPKVHVI